MVAPLAEREQGYMRDLPLYTLSARYQLWSLLFLNDGSTYWMEFRMPEAAKGHGDKTGSVGLVGTLETIEDRLRANTGFCPAELCHISLAIAKLVKDTSELKICLASLDADVVALKWGDSEKTPMPASGLKWLALNGQPSGRLLENSKLSAALKHKLDFTQQEWDLFGIKDLHADHFVKSGNSFFGPVALTRAPLVLDFASAVSIEKLVEKYSLRSMAKSLQNKLDVVRARRQAKNSQAAQELPSAQDALAESTAQHGGLDDDSLTDIINEKYSFSSRPASTAPEMLFLEARVGEGAGRVVTRNLPRLLSSEACDVFSLGVLMFRMITHGKYPYGVSKDGTESAKQMMNVHAGIGAKNLVAKSIWAGNKVRRAFVGTYRCNIEDALVVISVVNNQCKIVNNTPNFRGSQAYVDRKYFFETFLRKNLKDGHDQVMYSDLVGSVVYENQHASLIKWSNGTTWTRSVICCGRRKEACDRIDSLCYAFVQMLREMKFCMRRLPPEQGTQDQQAQPKTRLSMRTQSQARWITAASKINGADKAVGAGADAGALMWLQSPFW
jgi:hypothetical protein